MRASWSVAAGATITRLAWCCCCPPKEGRLGSVIAHVGCNCKYLRLSCPAALFACRLHSTAPASATKQSICLARSRVLRFAALLPCPAKRLLVPKTVGATASRASWTLDPRPSLSPACSSLPGHPLPPRSTLLPFFHPRSPLSLITALSVQQPAATEPSSSYDAPFWASLSCSSLARFLTTGALHHHQPTATHPRFAS